MVVYNKNFLKDVMLEMKYDSIILDRFDEFKEKVVDVFPQRVTKETIGTVLEISADGQSVSSKTKKIYLDSKNEDGSIRFSIQSDSASILFKSYLDKEILLACSKYLDLLIAHYNIPMIKRLGLRYVNLIPEFPEFDHSKGWSNYLKEDLTGAIDFASTIEGDVSRAMTSLHLIYPSSIVRFQYGLWNKDYPSKVLKKEFVLDYDCSTRLPLEADSPNLVHDKIAEYNAIVTKLFEDSMKDPLREYLAS